MTEPQPTLKEILEMDWEQILRDEILKESSEEFQRQYDKNLMTTLYGSSFADRVSYKKIKRRLFYEVIWWQPDRRQVKYFESAKRMRRFVNHLHSWYDGMVEIEKTWCYREFTPKHKWYYVSYRPDSFVCVEKY